MSGTLRISRCDLSGWHLCETAAARRLSCLVGLAVAEQTFRLMDPDSQRMMGLRADTTPQVARIATTRLIHAPIIQ